jgi:hypothetical protein
MNRANTLAAFAVGLLIAACVVQPQSQGTLPNNQAYNEGGGGGEGQYDGGSLIEGEYTCSFNSDGYQYGNFPCRVYRDNSGRKILEKLSGSQRIRGYVNEVDGGFDFEGQFYCPYGACDQNVRAEFQSFDDGAHSGTIQTDSGSVVVALQFLPDGFGGAAYGGGVYGGGLYGGAVYGGAVYGR